jgi:hypothetical protein
MREGFFVPNICSSFAVLERLSTPFDFDLTIGNCAPGTGELELSLLQRS